MEVLCKICNKKFITYPYKVKAGNGKFCSIKCFGKSIIGKKFTKQQIQKLSLSLMGNTNNNRKGKKFPLGEKHWKWKGGVSFKENYRNIKLKNWRKRNPNKVRASFNRRRLLTSDLNFSVIQLVYEDNIKKYGTLTCYLCLQPIPFGKDHLEHKQPLSRGGTNEYNNLEVSCQKCNCSKGNKTEEEFRNGKNFKTIK